MDGTQISHALTTESFSYRWLAKEPSSSNAEHNAISNSSLFQYEEAPQNFDFDISTSTLRDISLVHADKLFSNGVIKPQYLHSDTPKTDNNYESYSSPTISTLPSPSFGVNDSELHSSGEFEEIFPRKWSKLPRKFVYKCLSCLFPMEVKRVKIRVDDLNRKTMEVKSNSPPENASPRVRRQSYAWSDSDESSSINEAILYCKQSSGVRP